MTCIYHSKDLDGYCSGAIVKRKYPESKLVGYDYGQPFPLTDEELAGEDVIMIDVSLPMADMFGLLPKVKSLTWIDHHISAIKDFRAYVDGGSQIGISAVLEDGISACEGGWKYLFPDEKIPEAVLLLGKYDTWRNQDLIEWSRYIMPFQYGMRMICSSPEAFPQELLENNDAAIDQVNSIIKTGEIVLEYQRRQNEIACRYSFEIEFEGLRAICLNNGGANSQVFASVYDESKHDVMIPFVFTGKHWTFSLYTTKNNVDCSVIAKSKGGGGHKKAAGFKLDSLPENFKKND